MIAIYRSFADLEAAVGMEVGPSDWLALDQSRVDGFADTTNDHQWIHVDPERAADGPFGTTIAHGFLTLSLVPYFNTLLRRIENVRMGVNYGLNRVRFPAPVPVGSRIRGRLTLLSCDPIESSGGQPGTAAQLVTRAVVEVEGVDKPGCIAELVSRYYFD